jgi:hypothetical protein
VCAFWLNANPLAACKGAGKPRQRLSACALLAVCAERVSTRTGCVIAAHAHVHVMCICCAVLRPASKGGAGYDC